MDQTMPAAVPSCTFLQLAIVVCKMVSWFQVPTQLSCEGLPDAFSVNLSMWGILSYCLGIYLNNYSL